MLALVGPNSNERYINSNIRKYLSVPFEKGNIPAKSRLNGK